MTLKEVKKIGYKLTGLEITNYKNDITCFWFNRDRAFSININTCQLKKLYLENIYTYKYIWKLGKKYLYLQALLHEVAHFKTYKKLGGLYRKYYNRNTRYYETLANRYALRYYKRFVKN